METMTEKNTALLDQSLIQKLLEDVDKSEANRISAFRDLISESLKLLFIDIPNPDSHNDQTIWSKTKELTLKYDAVDFNSEFTLTELTTKTMQNTLHFKIPVIKVLKRLQNTYYSYFHKAEDKSGFEAHIKFTFKEISKDYYPVQVSLKLKQVPEKEEARKKLGNSIYYQFISNKNIKIPEIIQDRSKAKFKQSGHYIDQKLQHNFSLIEKKQLSIFETINPQLQNKIKDRINDEIMVEGIRITPAEDRILNAILKLLHDKSDDKKDYKGNLPPDTHLQYGGRPTYLPKIRFTPAELYKEYTGSQDYSGAEVQYIKDTLKALQDHSFLIVYKRRYWKDKTEVIDRIEEYMPLIKIITYYEALTVEEDTKLDNKDYSIADEKGEIILMLNPIFIDQIDTKFIEYPTDINKLTAIASGGGRKVTESIIRLRDYLLREISSKHEKAVINLDTLPYILGLDNYIKQKRRKLINSRVDEALDAVMKMGLVTGVNKITGAKGQDKIEFTLNLNF
jgi:hypothetical protein